MVEDQWKRFHFFYLDNTIFEPSKIKVIKKQFFWQIVYKAKFVLLKWGGKLMAYVINARIQSGQHQNEIQSKKFMLCQYAMICPGLYFNIRWQHQQ